MSNCNKNPLLRDGTSQQQRLLKALLPNYVSVDERSMDDLIRFAREYAKEINYYNPDNEPDGNWQSFFMKEVSSDERTDPHYALFIAFLELFRIAQDDMNTITQRHLDFYYRDVLKMNEKEAIPDQVHVIFDLAKHVGSHLLKKGTVLNAGKDKTGKERFYTTDRDIVLNPAKIKELKAFYIDSTGMYASPVANSSDGKGAPITDPEPKWKAFGQKNSELEASIGFAFASPLLFLAEGEREVTLTLTYDGPTVLDAALLKAGLKIEFTGEKEWLQPQADFTAITTKAVSSGFTLSGPVDLPVLNPFKGNGAIIAAIMPSTGAISRITSLVSRRPGPKQPKEPSIHELKIKVKLSDHQPAVVAYDKLALKDRIETRWPVMKLTLQGAETGETYALYQKLKSVRINKATIDVNVKGVRNLILQNDVAKLDPTKLFNPFSTRPEIGSAFYIGSKEVFQKKLSSLDVNIEWQGLPDLDKHYQNYLGELPSTAKFTIWADLLYARKWNRINISPDNKSTLRLFSPVAGEDFHTIAIPLVGSLSNYDRDTETGEFKQYDTNTKRGFLRLELTGSDFLHKRFQNSYTQKVLEFVTAGTNAGEVELPNEPYTPAIKTIWLNYTSSHTIDYISGTGANAPANHPEQFFHIEPFGAAEIKQASNKPVEILPQYNDLGTLYLGIEGLKPSQVLSLLFKVAEGTPDPDAKPKDIRWSYLVNNSWKDFPAANLLLDSTNDLLTSGIIAFDVPAEASAQNTVLTPGLHWIKGAIQRDPASAGHPEKQSVSDLIDIKSQAVTATFSEQDNDPQHLAQSLPAGIVKELEQSNSAISKVHQPFASFGGKLRENKGDFYKRVSERLRHKRRGITIWDYEHLVLEQFPSIYKVKCLNHTINDGTIYNELMPGHATLIAISNLRNKNAVDPLRPRTSLITLTEIGEFLKTINPPGVTLHVKNPFFEEIEVDFKVKFHAGYDKGFYTKQLEEDIKRFLAPWAYDSTDVMLGGKIHRSVIINFIEEREYVDFVLFFKMHHYPPGVSRDDGFQDVEEAITTTSSSILTSAPSHKIIALEKDECDFTVSSPEYKDNIVEVRNIAPLDDECACDTENEKLDKVLVSGIGRMGIEGNFIIGARRPDKTVGNMEIEKDFDIQ